MFVKILAQAAALGFGVLLVSLFLASESQAVEAPREFVLAVPTPTGHVLGGACFAVDTGDEALPCNPAFIAREVKSSFKADLLLGNNTQNLGDVTSLLSGDGNPETVRRLFAQTRPSEMEAEVEGAYRAPTFGVSIMPYRVLSYFLIRNSALPTMTLLAAQEQSAAVQFGSYWGDDWSWGVQLRGVQRKFISQTFTLTDALAEGGSQLWAPQTQNAFYIEPGLLKEWSHVDWRPQLSIAVAQTGFVDVKSTDFATAPELHVGGAIHPPVGLGRLELGADAVFHSQIEDWSDPFRFAITYELGATRFLGSASRSDYALGFVLRYEEITGGLTYDSKWIQNWIGEDEWVRTVTLQIGVEI